MTLTPNPTPADPDMFNVQPSRAAAIRARHAEKIAEEAISTSPTLAPSSGILALLLDVAAIGTTINLLTGPDGMFQISLSPHNPSVFPGLGVSHAQRDPRESLEEVIAQAVDQYRQAAARYLAPVARPGSPPGCQGHPGAGVVAGIRPVRSSLRAHQHASTPAAPQMGSYSGAAVPTSSQSFVHPLVARIEAEAKADAERRRMEREASHMLDVHPHGFVETIVPPAEPVDEVGPDLSPTEERSPHPFSPEGTFEAPEELPESPPLVAKPLDSTKPTARNRKKDPRA